MKQFAPRGTGEQLAEIVNDKVGVRVRKLPGSGGLVHEIFDRERPGHVIARSLVEHEDIAVPVVDVCKAEPDHAGGGRITLHGSSLGGECRIVIFVPPAGRSVHVQVELKRIASPAVSLLYEFCTKQVDFAFAPHLRPRARDVIPVWGMKTPATLLQSDRTLLAVIGDTRLMESLPGDLPLVLEMDCDRKQAKPPIVGMGIRPYIHHSLYCFETPGDLSQYPPLGDVTFAFYLYANAAAPARAGFTEVVRYIWQEFGHLRFDDVRPQTAGFDRYARLGFGYANGLWEDMDEGRGAVRSGIRYQNDVWFQSLFNHLRSAIGLKLFGRRWQDERIENMGDRIKRLALSSPQTPEGLFPTIFESGIEQAVRVERWHKSNHWMTSPLVETSMRKVLTGNPVKLMDWDQTFHIVDCSWQCYWMMRWHREVEPDPALIAYCERYATYLLKIQQPSGAFPSFLQGDELRASTLLMHNVGSAASGAFLAQLYLVTRNEQWLAAAVGAADFVASEVLPTRRWQDYEAIFDSKGKPLGMFDRHTGQYAQVTQGMIWSAAMYQGLEEASPGKGYGALAEEVVDYLSLFQQMWDAPFLSVQTFGGFPVGNGHPGWNDGRTSMIAQALLDQHHLGRRRDHLERGVAALRNSLVLMFMPENAAVSRWATDGATGNSDMSYGGRGRDERWCGYSYDFPVGPALTTFALAQARYGDIFVDTHQAYGIGINGFTVSDVVIGKDRVSLCARPTVEHRVPPVLKMSGLGPGEWRVELNSQDLGSFPAAALDAGVRLKPGTYEEKKGA